MESFFTEIGLLVTEIDYILENLKHWMAPAEVSYHLQFSLYLLKNYLEPLLF